MVKAIIFLGNPGALYSKTRHNFGFQVAGFIWQDKNWKEKFKALWNQEKLSGNTVHLLMPQTFMNKSGESAAALAAFFKLNSRELLAVHDDLETPFGTILFKKGGGTAGHNGLRSLQQHMGSPDFYRLALGISRPAREDPATYVLNRFSQAEEARLPEIYSYTEDFIKKLFESPLPDSDLPQKRCILTL